MAPQHVPKRALHLFSVSLENIADRCRANDKLTVKNSWKGSATEKTSE